MSNWRDALRIMSLTDDYELAIRRLRAAGCRCPLRWCDRTQTAIPATGCDLHTNRLSCYFVAQSAWSDASPPPPPPSPSQT